MTKVDDFKNFVKKNPKLVTFVRNNKMTWQSFYELYDLYGEDSKVWNEYLEEKKEISTKDKTSSTFANIMKMAQNVDTDKLQDGISSIQKAIGLFGDMLIKDNKEESSNYTPRPIYRRFDD